MVYIFMVVFGLANDASVGRAQSDVDSFPSGKIASRSYLNGVERIKCWYGRRWKKETTGLRELEELGRLDVRFLYIHIYIWGGGAVDEKGRNYIVKSVE